MTTKIAAEFMIGQTHITLMTFGSRFAGNTTGQRGVSSSVLKEYNLFLTFQTRLNFMNKFMGELTL